jgi:peptide deformylase
MTKIPEEHNPQSLTMEIITFGDEILKQKAREVTDINDQIRQIAGRMVRTMHSAPGIGLAAPQVNQSIRLITADLSVGQNKEDLIILLNPRITHKEGQDILEEGCLSVPGINEKVTRPLHVICRGISLAGSERTIEAEGLLARVLCHEVDHLNGILFIDHLSPLKKKLIKKKLRQIQE